MFNENLLKQLRTLRVDDSNMEPSNPRLSWSANLAQRSGLNPTGASPAGRFVRPPFPATITNSANAQQSGTGTSNQLVPVAAICQDIPNDLLGCMERLLCMADHSHDIEFLVGQDQNVQTLKAHKNILAARSVVFQAMFYGPLKENRPVIEIPDCTPEVFYYTLRYAYTDKTDDIPVELIMSCLYVAIKYQLEGFMRALCVACKSNATPDRACDLLQQAIDLQQEDLVDSLVEYVCREAEYVLPKDAFNACSREIVDRVLARDDLSLSSEVKTFNAVVRWGKHQCHLADQDGEDAAILKEFLGPLLYRVRFNRMSPKDLATSVEKSRLLSPDELLAIFLNIHSYRQTPLEEHLNHGARSGGLRSVTTSGGNLMFVRRFRPTFPVPTHHPPPYPLTPP